MHRSESTLLSSACKCWYFSKLPPTMTCKFTRSTYSFHLIASERLNSFTNVVWLKFYYLYILLINKSSCLDRVKRRVTSYIPPICPIYTKNPVACIFRSPTKTFYKEFDYYILGFDSSLLIRSTGSLTVISEDFFRICESADKSLFRVLFLTLFLFKILPIVQLGWLSCRHQRSVVRLT